MITVQTDGSRRRGIPSLSRIRSSLLSRVDLVALQRVVIDLLCFLVGDVDRVVRGSGKLRGCERSARCVLVGGRCADISARPSGHLMSPEPVRRKLSGRSSDELASQAVWGAFPVTRSNDEHRAALLSWYGVTGPAPPLEELLRESGHTGSWIRKLTGAAARNVREQTQPLTPPQVELLSAPIEPTEDQLARVRRAQLFGIRRPPIARPRGRRQQAFVDLAVRCVAALGPLTTDQLTAAIIEARLRKQHRGDQYEDLADVLRRTDRLTFNGDTGLYELTEAIPAMFRDAELVAELRKLPRVFSYRDYRITVQGLGFSNAYRAPVAVHVDVGRGRFALVNQLRDDLRFRPPPRS